jgi:hypothetical protein
MASGAAGVAESPQPMTVQNLAHGARCGPGGVRLQRGEPVEAVCGAPVRTLPAQLHQARLKRHRRHVRVRVRPGSAARIPGQPSASYRVITCSRFSG